MARKSRKPQASISGSAVKMNTSDCLRAAAYLRISEVKDDLPPESIENQLKIVQEFLKYQPDISLTATYSDINASGRNFQRKGFQKMLTAIEAGKIDCVIVKDLSRLGRNVIETGYYIEMYFPLHHVRLISVTDHVDTVDGVKNLNKGNSNSIPLINLLNETVSNEISRNTQTVLDAYAAEGKYIAPRAPYGYRKSLDDCHKLLVDPEAADVVREIFSMAQNGMGLTEIVRRLNQTNILPPSLYARQHGLSGNYQDAGGCWNTRTLKKLLTNLTYTGSLLQGRHQISVSNTHEPIVSMEVFKAVQNRLSSAPPQKQLTKKLPRIPCGEKSFVSIVAARCREKGAAAKPIGISLPVLRKIGVALIIVPESIYVNQTSLRRSIKSFQCNNLNLLHLKPRVRKGL